MNTTYTQSFEERIAELEATIHHYKELIEYYNTIGETERAHYIFEDIEELEEEIKEVKAEQRQYLQNVGFAD